MNMAVVLWLLSGEVAGVAPPRLAPVAQAKVDHEKQFARALPANGDTHAIANWDFYAALASGDVIAYAQCVDPEMADQVARAKGKPYQTQLLGRQILNDPVMAASFKDQRTRLQRMAVSASALGFASNKCEQQLVFVDNEFRLVLGEGGGKLDPLSRSIIAPGCHATPTAIFQLTAGRSRRFVCWPTEAETKCGWRLGDMPAALKAVVETHYPSTLTLRWRWRGLGAPVRTRYEDNDGNRVNSGRGVMLAVPQELSLEFVDATGNVVWRAPAR